MAPYQFDIKNVFPTSDLEEVQPPPSFWHVEEKGKVCRLKKVLYVWLERFRLAMLKKGYTKCQSIIHANVGYITHH